MAEAFIREEIIAAFTESCYPCPSINKWDEIFNLILRKRAEIPGAYSFTAAELRGSFTRARRDPAEADRVLQDIRDHREDFGDGDVAKDADGYYWCRVDNEGDTGWQVFGNLQVFPDDKPKRPLRPA
jgi:hypothetical protein